MHVTNRKFCQMYAGNLLGLRINSVNNRHFPPSTSARLVEPKRGWGGQFIVMRFLYSCPPDLDSVPLFAGTRERS